MTKTVVILLSDKRSGSTLFERELCKHKDISHVSYTPHTYNETHYWVKAAYLLFDTGEGFSGGVRPAGYGSKAAARKSLLKTIQGNVPDFLPPDNDEQLVFEGWEALCRQFANPIFFEKSPHHAHHWAALELMLKWIEQTDYQVRVVGLVRNPMAVMYSALQLFYTAPESRQFGWVEGNRNILKLADLLGNERFRLVKYEDIVGDATASFAGICGFIGVDYQGRIGGAANTESLYKWRDDPAFHFQLDEGVAAFASELGYSEGDLFNPPKPKTGAVEKVVRSLRLNFRRAYAKLYNKVKRLVD